MFIEETRDQHYNKIYKVTIEHKKLHKYQVITGKERNVVEQKASAKIAQWDTQWEKQQKKESDNLDKEHRKKDIEKKIAVSDTKTEKATQKIESLSHILSKTLSKSNHYTWKNFYKLQNNLDLSEPKKPLRKSKTDKPKPPNPKSKPVEPEPVEKPNRPSIPHEPVRTDSRYNPHVNIIDRLFKSLIQKKKKEMDDRFQSDYQKWVDEKNKIEAKYSDLLNKWNQETKDRESQYREAVKRWEQDVNDSESKYQEALKTWKETNELDYQRSLKGWEHLKQEYLQKKSEIQTILENKKREYLDKATEAVIEVCKKALENLEYPNFFPQSYELEYTDSNKMLIIDYQLPSPSNIPRLKEITYVKTDDRFKETYLPQSKINDLYNSAVYQVALSIPYVLFNANHQDVIAQIVFNGFVKSIDPSTGKKLVACIVSLQTNRDEFMEINLENVDPKACFRKLKGIGSSQLHSITPIAPVLNITRKDKRFVASYEVAHTIDESVNIAAMDWEDFEHLIRELFEQEFSQYGGEVKITQASRDRGVDAVAFDPDPIRGGKIVIQAKRYTNTVGVSAVRDLYGTIINEGATKGILISTADYGPDAYDFAKGKPLTLLNGGNLLHLLLKHGHKAKIDLQEAKQLIAEKDKEKESKY